MLICDYCGKNQNEVKKIISGNNGAAICGDCVLISAKVITEDSVVVYDKSSLPITKFIEYL